MSDKPSYVSNFNKPKNTEIKHINGYWYLYQKSSVYDPETKKMRKKSGKCLGKITQEGFIASKEKIDYRTFEDIEIKEAGFSGYLYAKNKEMIERLKRLFPDIWREIFVIASLRLVYDVRFKRISEYYEVSILSEIYPGLKLDAPYITGILKTIGKRNSAIKAFMHEDNNRLSSFMVFDGHRIISDSKTLETVEMGYDSKMRYKPQINLVYAFSVSGERCFPYYYKQFTGDVPDVSAFSTLIEEAEIKKDSLTILADKGFGSEDNFTLIDESGFKYIVPLKRDANDTTDNVPSSIDGYDDTFTFDGRAILHKEVKKDGYTIHIFLDMALLSAELSDSVSRTEKSNNTINLAREKEEERIKKGNKRRLTDEELSKLKAISFQDFIKGKNTLGTITMRTNNQELTGVQAYTLYKGRNSIEEFFKSYDNSLDFSASYMRNNYSEDGWLFFNHLAAIMAFDILDEIYSSGQTKNVSLKDFKNILSHVFAHKIKGEWRSAKITSKKQEFMNNFSFDINTVIDEMNAVGKSSNKESC